jgi:hypothetical protein
MQIRKDLRLRTASQHQAKTGYQRGQGNESNGLSHNRKRGIRLQRDTSSRWLSASLLIDTRSLMVYGMIFVKTTRCVKKH